MELSKSIQMFYKTVIESSSDEESNDDTELMMAAAMLLHEQSSRPVYRGSVKGRNPMSSATVRRATTNSTATTFIIPTQSLMRKDSDVATRCHESCS
jgi:hypothetical protein